MYRTIVVFAAATVAIGLTASGPAQDAAAEAIMPPNLAGVWSGEGQVQKDENSKPISVRCNLTSEQSPTSIDFDGECRAMLIMKREIGAELTREGERFTGVYIGSRAGPAQLDGTMTAPNTLTLSMTFEREVNGDDQAVMTIERPQDDRFTITTVDTMVSGAEVTTSQITFLKD